jgi:hypothetical protein
MLGAQIQTIKRIYAILSQLISCARAGAKAFLKVLATKKFRSWVSVG